MEQLIKFLSSPLIGLYHPRVKQTFGKVNLVLKALFKI
jgi:hypothetical protein